MLSRDSVVTSSKNQISSDLAGEAVILDLKTGVYYGLDEVGARVWTLMQEPTSVRQITDVIVSEYDVDPTRCEADLIDLIQDMASKGLVEVNNAKGA